MPDTISVLRWAAREMLRLQSPPDPARLQRLSLFGLVATDVNTIRGSDRPMAASQNEPDPGTSAGQSISSSHSFTGRWSRRTVMVSPSDTANDAGLKGDLAEDATI